MIMTETILLADDDKEFRAEFKELLDGYHVKEASDGREALDILQKANDIDLVILDINMPRMNGLDVLTSAKKIDPNLKIIILTGHSSKDVAIEALKGHADDYIEKPPNPEKVQKVIENLLEKKYTGDSIENTGSKGKIERVKRFLERNCYKKTRLEDAAQAVCISAKYLSRIFKEITGESYVQYRLGIMIEKAKEFLNKEGSNISQIAYKLGYENPESFIRQFKKFTAKTPAEYRKKMAGVKKPSKRAGK